MNYRVVFYVIGLVLQVEGLFLALPLIVSLIYQENSWYFYLLPAIACFVIGWLLSRRKPTHETLYPRDGFITVALSWLVLSAAGAVPFVLTGDIPHYIDALFETISGFTTTGSSILTDVEALSKSGLFWRSFTHWVGGMGVVVFIMALLPMVGASTMNLMKAESPGPSVERLVPHVKDTASLLYTIYIGMTAVEIICLLLSGMSLFESLTLTFGTVGTGGFGVLNSSIGSYSTLQQYIIAVFMILSGINYSCYFLLFSKKIKDALKMQEVHWYLGIIAISVIAITINIRSIAPNLPTAFRDALFQVGSIITTTGYSTADFGKWPAFSQTILVILMFIGACAGSTGGGIKVSRIMILGKTIRKELATIVHPRVIKKIRMDDHIIAHETTRSTNVYIAVYSIILFLSVLLISVDEFDFTTNFTAVVATLNNIGPGLNMIGPAGNFSQFSYFSKIILMFDMLAGRLELFPMLVLFAPSCWARPVKLSFRVKNLLPWRRG
ncbi:MAG: TrkH family potassium uptake protein [Lachnospiraceae bacterium]|nr:TrkH family potassium uptake protein [Lachnospiraceae bacterium]